MICQSLAFLVSVAWWRQALRTAISVVEQFLFPALGMAIANMATVAAGYYVFNATKGEEVNIEVLLRATAIAGGAALLAIVLSIWMLAIWLVKLTAYCRALLQFPESPSNKNFRICVGEIRTRRMFLFQVWLIGSVYMLVPGIVFSNLFIAKTFLASKYSLPAISVAPWVSGALSAALVVFTILIAAYSFVLMVLSAISSQTASQTASQAWKLLIQEWKPLTVISGLVLILNLVIGAPQAIPALWNNSGLDFVNSTLVSQLACQFWLGLSSAILWPLSLAPFCTFLKDKLSGYQSKI